MNCKFASNWNNRLKHHSKEQLNELLRKKIKQRFEPQHMTGHFIEQHLYLNTEDDPTIKIHVLKYENLNTEFNELIQIFSSVDLTKERSNVSTIRIFELEDLDKESKKLIQEVYKNDFVLFNYQI